MRCTFDHFVLDTEQCVLWREGGELVPLSPKVFETLQLLISAKGRVVSKQEFMDALWKESFVEEANLTQNIFVLRKVLGPAPSGRSYIETVPKRGYRFVGNVNEISAAAPLETEPGTETVSLMAVEARSLVPALASAAPATRHARAVRQLALMSLPILTLVFLLGGYFALHSEARVQIGGYQRLTNDGNSKGPANMFGAIIPDGNRLFFNELKGNETVLAQVPTTGGEIAYGAAPSPNAEVVGLQPGNAGLLFGSAWVTEDVQPLISKEFASGAFAPIFNLRAHDASWSHDGKQLAYAQYGKLFVRSADGSSRLAASVKGFIYWPRWSPDDRVLRFSENYDGYHDRLWQVDTTGANLQPMFAKQEDNDRVCCGSWTPSGRAFLYMSRELHSSSIHVRPEPGGPGERLLHWAGWGGRQPSIDIPAAPLDTWRAAVPGLDGRHVYAVGEQLHGQLVRIDPVTRKPEPYLGGISAEGVSFSPDRAELVWTAYPEGTLWRSRVDGTDRLQLTQSPLIARFPHWSPDGNTIVFTAARPGLDWQLYTVPAAGSAGDRGVKLLLQQSTGQGVATWSPDGKALAFGHILGASERQTRPSAIEIYRPSMGATSLVPGSSGLWTARWSPDGRYLSAVNGDNQTLRLYDFETGTWSDLAHASINDVVWTWDSKYLFFDTAFGAKPVLYRVQISNKKLEPYADLENIRRAGFFAPWVGVTPDGAPLLLEDASIQELYSVAVDLP